MCTKSLENPHKVELTPFIQCQQTKICFSVVYIGLHYSVYGFLFSDHTMCVISSQIDVLFSNVLLTILSQFSSVCDTIC